MTDNRIPRILPGGVYCSPGCGFGCKKAAHDRAHKEADLLAASLGDGWEAVVWENCGWSYRAQNGVAQVYPRKNGSSLSGDYEVTGYTAFLNTAKQVVVTADTAEDAVGFAVQDARTIARRIADDCAALTFGTLVPA